MNWIATLPRLPARPRAGHKGTFGKVLIVAGSRGMSGAAVLAGRAALRGGAGLVQVAVPESIQPSVAAAEPCYLTTGLPETTAGTLAGSAWPRLRELVAWADVVAVGPGIGAGQGTQFLVERLLATVERPLIVDADGLNAWAELRRQGRELNPKSPSFVITPHPGEFARLAGATPKDQAERTTAAWAWATANPGVLVLKGAGTLVTDGRHIYRNATGNPGLATGGTGDVLTGLLAALVAQGLAAFDAAQAAVHVHGLAGDLAAQVRGEAGLIATDLIDHLPAALRTLETPAGSVS